MTRYTPQWLQAGSYAASQDRRLLTALWPGVASSGLAVSVASGMTLNVAPGQAAVPSPNNTGSMLCTSDAVEQVVLPAAPGSGVNRYDLIIARPRSADWNTGATEDFIFDVVSGTAVASPVVPATPPGTLALAQVYVGGQVAAIVAGNITDVRPSGLSIGSVPPAPSYPRGVVAFGAGPPSLTDCTASNVVLQLAPVQVVAGRWYRITGNAQATQITGTGTPVQAWITDETGNTVPQGSATAQPIIGQSIYYANSLVAGLTILGTLVAHWQAPASGAKTWKMQIRSSAGSAQRVTAYNCSIAVEDAGG